MLDLQILVAFDPTHPIRRAYDQAYALAHPTGTYDNLSKRVRYAYLFQLAGQAVARFPSLDIVECGCFRGLSSHMIAMAARSAGLSGRFHIFDSFEGLSAFTDHDDSVYFPNKDSKDQVRSYFQSDEAHVMEVLRNFPFVQTYKGWIPDRFLDVEEREFSFVSIDVDIYEPTRDSAAFFYDRLVPGGMMYIDDYGSKRWPGCMKAIDALVAARKPSLFIANPLTSAYLIK